MLVISCKWQVLNLKEHSQSTISTHYLLPILLVLFKIWIVIHAVFYTLLEVSCHVSKALPYQDKVKVKVIQLKLCHILTILYSPMLWMRSRSKDRLSHISSSLLDQGHKFEIMFYLAYLCLFDHVLHRWQK